MKRPEIVATITDSLELSYSVPKMLSYHLGTIGKGKRVRVDIKKYSKPSTNPQRGYLWAVVYPTICSYIFDTTGQRFTSENLHERYKKKLIGYESCELPGMIDLQKVKSTKDLTAEEFWDDFIEHVCKEWAELGLYVPLPEKKDKDQ